jgi:hypothetical protein
MMMTRRKNGILLILVMIVVYFAAKVAVAAAADAVEFGRPFLWCLSDSIVIMNYWISKVCN